MSELFLKYKYVSKMAWDIHTDTQTRFRYLSVIYSHAAGHPVFLSVQLAAPPRCPGPRPSGSWYLQEAGELAVAIVDVLVGALVTQCIDAVAQGQQRAVDVGPLFHALPTVLRLGW